MMKDYKNMTQEELEKEVTNIVHKKSKPCGQKRH